MRQADDRPFKVTLERADPAAGRAHRGRVRELVRGLPALDERRPEPARHLPRRGPPPPAHPRHGLRRALFPADPSDRPHQPQGPQQHPHPAPDDPGSPYAIGSAEGGHDAIHPELGSLEDFQHLRQEAAEHGIELALDFAIQCSPDHPWLKQHPEWFDWRPDGSIRYAENPPKKYQDIVNVDFYAKGAIPGLWVALHEVVLFWARQGVRLFRVDNPHTKSFPFWEWMIAEVQRRYPDASSSPRRSPGRR